MFSPLLNENCQGSKKNRGRANAQIGTTQWGAFEGGYRALISRSSMRKKLAKKNGNGGKNNHDPSRGKPIRLQANTEHASRMAWLESNRCGIGGCERGLGDF